MKISKILIYIFTFGLVVAFAIIGAQKVFALLIIPQPTMYTLNDIYARLTTNATASSHTLTPSGSQSTMVVRSLSEIYNAIPTIDPTKVLTGTTYLGIAGTATAPLVWGDDDSNTYTWDQAVAHCASKTDGGYAWRLPNISELLKGMSDQFIIGSGSGFFVDTSYWSGTVNSDIFAWSADYNDGSTSYIDNKSTEKLTRCVH
jgi:hypothetical protein